MIATRASGRVTCFRRTKTQLVLTAENAETAELTPNELTEHIIGAVIEVHRALGPGLLEATYEACLMHELVARHLFVERQKALPLVYKGVRVDRGYRIDLLVEHEVIVEVKSVERLERVHTAQLLSYLRLSGLRVGLLLNFNVRQLKTGLRRIVHKFPESPSAISASSAVNADS